MAFDYKEYAKQMRENAVKDDNGVIKCSPELWEQIASIIEGIPSADVVEVVRCKDCKHLVYWADEKRCYCNRTYCYTNRDDFCSYGERRDT